MTHSKLAKSASRQHYLKAYDSLERFISYYHQIDSILRTEPSSVLEIGIGTRVLSGYLRFRGIKVTTCDLERSLGPDILADLRSLPFKERSFDTVAAFQILEHVPFVDFESALAELKRVSGRYVVISLPYSCLSLDVAVNLSLKLTKCMLHGGLKVPLFLLPARWSRHGQHFWEIGRRGYPKRRIRKIIARHFEIVAEFHPPLNSYHYFWVLKKQI